MACPNCGCALEVCRNLNDEAGTVACDRCGSLFYPGAHKPFFVPKCSQPREYKELPDADDYWFVWGGNGWTLVYIRVERGVPYYDSTNSIAGKGRWLKIEWPPPPSQPKSAAERLREIAGRCGMVSKGLQHQVEEIADELEGRDA